MQHTLFTSFVLASLASVAVAEPAPTPESHLLLPYFEVALEGRGEATFFSLVNASSREVGLNAKVYTNWAIPVLEVEIRLAGKEVLQVDLHDWIAGGELPDGATVCPGGEDDCLELTHLRAALAGDPSTIDGLYYGSEVEPGLATGFVTIVSDGRFLAESDVLWGDYFYSDPTESFAQGQRLVRHEPELAGADLCRRHSVRFLDGGAFSGGTKLTVWNWDGVEGEPSERPEPPFELGQARLDVYGQDGRLIDVLPALPVLPAQTIRVSDLDLRHGFGWIDLATSESSSVAGFYRAMGRFSVGVPSWCLPCDPCDENGACYEPGRAECAAASCFPPRISIDGSDRGEVGRELSLTYTVWGTTRAQVDVSELPFGLVHESPKIFGVPALATSFTIRAKNECGIAQETIDIRPPVSSSTYLRVVKEVVNDDGGTASVADFPLFIDGRRVESGFRNPVEPGHHTVSEENVPGYETVSWRGDCDAAGRVTLVPGDDKICILTSDDLAAR